MQFAYMRPKNLDKGNFLQDSTDSPEEEASYAQDSQVQHFGL